MKTNYIRHLNAFFAQVKKDDRLHANHVSLYMALFQVWNRHHFRKSFPILREEVIKLCRIGSMNTYTRCLKDLYRLGYIVYQQGQLTSPGIVTMLSLPGSTDEEHQQLELFEGAGRTSVEPADCKRVIGSRRKNDTDVDSKNATVPCRKNDTMPVAILRRLNNKQINNYKREREKELPPSKKRFKNDIKDAPFDQDTPRAENTAPAERALPTLMQVKQVFSMHSYPPLEADKFFHHYQANGWRQGGQTLITDWEAAGHKWILNIRPLKTVIHERNTPLSRLHVNQNKSYSDPL